MLLPPGGFKSQKNNSRTPCVPMFDISSIASFKVVEHGFQEPMPNSP